jgi:hypothetical protein
VLLAATGVISGILVNPSTTATTVHVPTPAGPSVAVTREEPPIRTEAPTMPPSGALVAEAPSTVTVTPRTPANASDTRVAFGGAGLEPAPPPIRVTRAAAKRPRAVTPRPASFVIPVSTDDPRESHSDVAPPQPRAEEPWTTSLLRVAPQAP